MNTSQTSELFQRYNFTDDASRNAAVRAFNIIDRPLKGPAAFVVTGPPASGKTRLIREVIRAAFPGMPEGPHSLDLSPPAKAAALGEAARRGFLHIHAERGLLSDYTLRAFITPDRRNVWQWRKLHTTTCETAANRCAVFIESPSLMIDADLARLAHFIRLEC